MTETIRGAVLDERVRLTLHEVCHICGAAEETIIEMVREGVAEASSRGGEWTFTGIAVTRIQTALRLQRDLDVNLAGAALALELLDEIERLRRRVRR